MTRIINPISCPLPNNYFTPSGPYGNIDDAGLGSRASLITLVLNFVVSSFIVSSFVFPSFVFPSFVFPSFVFSNLVFSIFVVSSFVFSIFVVSSFVGLSSGHFFEGGSDPGIQNGTSGRIVGGGECLGCFSPRADHIANACFALQNDLTRNRKARDNGPDISATAASDMDAGFWNVRVTEPSCGAADLEHHNAEAAYLCTSQESVLSSRLSQLVPKAIHNAPFLMACLAAHLTCNVIDFIISVFIADLAAIVASKAPALVAYWCPMRGSRKRKSSSNTALRLANRVKRNRVSLPCDSSNFPSRLLCWMTLASAARANQIGSGQTTSSVSDFGQLFIAHALRLLGEILIAACGVAFVLITQRLISRNRFRKNQGLMWIMVVSALSSSSASFRETSSMTMRLTIFLVNLWATASFGHAEFEQQHIKERWPFIIFITLFIDIFVVGVMFGEFSAIVGFFPPLLSFLMLCFTFVAPYSPRIHILPPPATTPS